MNARQLMTSAHFFMEMGQELLRVSNGKQTIELELERQADGRLTNGCKNEITGKLQQFIGHKSWQPRARVYCSIGARGVSLRHLALPTGSKDEVEKLLPFQVEREFPLPLEQLAWGAKALNGIKTAAAHSNGRQEFLVAAVRKDTLEEYASILANCGAVPVFTLAALDRTYVCPQPPGAYAVLSIERSYSELITIEAGVPVAVRVLPWGRDDLSRGSARTLPRSEATSAEIATFGGTGPVPSEVSASVAGELVALMNGQVLGRALYLTGLGDDPRGLQFVADLAARVGQGIECRIVELANRSDSPAILGLQRAVESNGGIPPLVLQVKQLKKTSRMPPREQLKWAGVAAGLLLLALLIPYGEALALKSHVASKLAAIKNDQGRLAVIERELDFLEYLQANEPPYLDALLVLAKSSPPGTRFDSVSMNRRGELSLRGSLHDGQQVADLRTKLIGSGFFASVGVEEQAPTPDRQKVNVRMTAQWKPAASRILPSAEPATATSDSKKLPAPMATPPLSNPGTSAPAIKPAVSKPGKN